MSGAPVEGADLSLDVHGVTVSLSSELDAFTRYAAVSLEPFVRADGHAVAPRIVSRLEWVDGAPPRDLRAAFGVERWERRPDRDLYLSGPSAYWLRIDDFEDLQLALMWQDGRLLVRGRYYFRVGRGRGERLRRLAYRGRLDRLRARRFSTLVYYLVYHPVLWLLSREQGWHVLHAGAVASAGGAAVFAGMPGCGKSTLAVAMTADRAWTMQSDNLLLTDGARVLACPEPLLLDRRSIERIGAAANRLRATGDRRVYERDAYRPDTAMLEPVAPAAIFQVERAERADRTRCERIAPAACAAAFAADNVMAKEVRRIGIMAEVLDLTAGTGATRDARGALERLAASAPAYALAVGEGSDLASVVRDHVLPAVGAPFVSAKPAVSSAKPSPSPSSANPSSATASDKPSSAAASAKPSPATASDNPALASSPPRRSRG